MDSSHLRVDLVITVMFYSGLSALPVETKTVSIVGTVHNNAIHARLVSQKIDSLESASHAIRRTLDVAMFAIWDSMVGKHFVLNVLKVSISTH